MSLSSPGAASRLVRFPAAAALLALLALPARTPAQDYSSADVSGAWSAELTPADAATTAMPAPFKHKVTVFLSNSGGQITGTTVDKFGLCGEALLPLAGTQTGVAFALDANGAVPDPADCTLSGTLTLTFDATLGDNAHATATCTGTADVGSMQTPLAFTAKLTRVSGMQTPTDPDGSGPGVPVDEIGSGLPGELGANDLAITRIKAPKLVVMNPNLAAIQREIVVTIQNRGQHKEVIADSATLLALVTLQEEKVGGEQGIVLIWPRPPVDNAFPLKLAPRQKLNVFFIVTFEPTDDPPGSGGLAPGVFAWSATVDHAALPGAVPDDHPADDVAPRGVLAPFTFDCYPDGKIRERGVGSKLPDGTLGGPVLTKYAVHG